MFCDSLRGSINAYKEFCLLCILISITKTKKGKRNEVKSYH